MLHAVQTEKNVTYSMSMIKPKLNWIEFEGIQITQGNALPATVIPCQSINLNFHND